MSRFWLMLASTLGLALWLAACAPGNSLTPTSPGTDANQPETGGGSGGGGGMGY